MQLEAWIKAANAELPFIGEETFTVLVFEPTFSALQRRKRADIGEMLRESGLRDALRLTGVPTVPDAEITRRARRLFRLLYRIVVRMNSHFGESDVVFLCEFFERWTNISKARLGTAL